ncbi:MAG: C1 family peptidase [Paludibacteraceae bacterium]|nr:C1 family peptidase [Paludibacteraceae bacterium]
MRKLLFLAGLLVAVHLPAQNLLNVYRNDGTVSQYQVSELDSIGFGEITVPSAIDLRQSPCLPNIMQQGQVGCCASAAITYMMYSNAYARYMQSLYPENNFHPASGSESMQFSPKFTYNLGGAGTAWVLETIKEQGVPPRMYSNFNNWESWASDDAVAKSWSATPGVWDMAQNFRLNHYEQIWFSTYNYQMTTSPGGRQLLDRIKELLRAGNVVMTGGYSNYWCSDTVKITNPGQFARSGEVAIPYCVRNENPEGGHQVCFIGYDDDITCVKNGVTLKGAFLVANSWGNWCKTGCVWLMYDALNQQSEYAALNVANRIFAMDQVVLFDWRTDLELGYPEQTVQLGLELTNREALQIQLFRFDKQTKEYAYYEPYVIRYANRHPYYPESLNLNGAQGVSSGELVFNYDSLMTYLPAGKTKDDYVWGVCVGNMAAQQVVVRSIAGCNAHRQVFYSHQPAVSVGSNQHVMLALESDGVHTHYTVSNGVFQENVVPQPETKALSVYALYDEIENFDGRTYFIVGLTCDNNDRLVENLKSGQYLLRMVVQDETDRKRYTIEQYHFTLPDIEFYFYNSSFIRVNPCNFGLVPVYGHRYTIQLSVFESGQMVYQGVSPTGDFDKANTAFLTNGPIIPNPVPYTCRVEDF